MRSPTPFEIRTAIQVLQKLTERINTHAAHFATQLPDTRLGSDYAAQSGARAIDQSTRIESVKSQLENWRDELVQQRKQCVSNHV